MTEELFNEIMDWQTKTFGKADVLSKIAHLREEVDELEKDIKEGSDGERHELADCFNLLFGIARSRGYSYMDIQDIIKEKFEILKTREWSEPDENGVVRHIKK